MSHKKQLLSLTAGTLLAGSALSFPLQADTNQGFQVIGEGQDVREEVMQCKHSGNSSPCSKKRSTHDGSEASCGEGKCGGMKSGSEGACGEGKCGGMKSGSEGSCGEGKCGSMKSGSEGACGEGKCGGMKSGSEGSCGEGKCGSSSTQEPTSVFGR